MAIILVIICCITYKLTFCGRQGIPKEPFNLSDMKSHQKFANYKQNHIVFTLFYQTIYFFNFRAIFKHLFRRFCLSLIVCKYDTQSNHLDLN